MSNDNISKEDLLELIRELKSPGKEVPILSHEEIQVLREIINDRKAMSRAWNFLLYALGSVSTIIVSYGIISGSFFDWIKNSIK